MSNFILVPIVELLLSFVRQQREEITRKKEKLDAILKGKRSGLARPESPGTRRRRIKRPSMPGRHLSARYSHSEVSRN